MEDDFEEEDVEDHHQLPRLFQWLWGNDALSDLSVTVELLQDDSLTSTTNTSTSCAKKRGPGENKGGKLNVEKRRSNLNKL